MKIREGLIPTVLGSAVTLGGIVLRDLNPLIAWGIAGFGVAHIILGTIDIVEHRHWGGTDRG